MTAKPKPAGGNLPLTEWDAGRDERGATGSERTPRCTTRGCPVRFSSGADRACREHAADEEVRADEATGPGLRGGMAGWELTDAERADLRRDRSDGPWHD